jgi:chaperonin GroEL (HSP60 family)
MIELSRTQDEQVGDGTTSVIILGELVLICLSAVGILLHQHFQAWLQSEKFQATG